MVPFPTLVGTRHLDFLLYNPSFPPPPQNSPLCPHLVLIASSYGVRMAVLDGRVSGDDVTRWHSYKTYRSLLSDLVSKLDLIVPSSDLVGSVLDLDARRPPLPPSLC